MKKTKKTSNGLGFRLDLEIKLVGFDFWKVFTWLALVKTSNILTIFYSIVKSSFAIKWIIKKKKKSLAIKWKTIL